MISKLLILNHLFLFIWTKIASSIWSSLFFFTTISKQKESNPAKSCKQLLSNGGKSLRIRVYVFTRIPYQSVNLTFPINYLSFSSGEVYFSDIFFTSVLFFYQLHWLNDPEMKPHVNVYSFSIFPTGNFNNTETHFLENIIIMVIYDLSFRSTCYYFVFQKYLQLFQLISKFFPL